MEFIESDAHIFVVSSSASSIAEHGAKSEPTSKVNDWLYLVCSACSGSESKIQSQRHLMASVASYDELVLAEIGVEVDELGKTPQKLDDPYPFNRN